MFYTYILYNSTIDKYYVGYSSNLHNRIAQHNSSSHKSKFTRKQPGTWVLVFSEQFNSRKNALFREKQIKSWKSKKKITELVEQSQ